MLIAAKRKNATDLVRPCASKALLPLEEHVRDAEIDLWKKGKQTQQSPPETEEGNEGIACRARSQNLRKTIFAVDAVEIYDQGGFPARIEPPRRLDTIAPA
ncbi:hypothetical protein FHX12_001347 [Rhizobium sp. BK609]|nr:hypothetical protein [Rhizobium sp. BK098]MBB3614385.1 hypothetical protein [Rhizobium sp. BK609]MBB3680229.1 hypothetical protein [Rhizobium sp. BK612]